jgi:uncharacterized membrane protein
MHTFLLTLHVVGAGILAGGVVFSIILAIKGQIGIERLKIIQSIRNISIGAVALQVVTGFILYSLGADEFKRNLFFWIKMALFVLDGIIAVLIVDRKIKLISAASATSPIALGKIPLWLLVNLVIVLSIITLGVMITEH